MEIGNILLKTFDYKQRLQLTNRAGSVAGQAAMLTRDIDLNTIRNKNPEVMKDSESFPNQVADSPSQRAAKLLDTV
jgi:hypothetical protein